MKLISSLSSVHSSYSQLDYNTGCLPQKFMIVHGHDHHHFSVFLTWLYVGVTCWAAGAGRRKPGLGRRRRSSSSPGRRGRMGLCRRRYRSRWGSGPRCSSWPASSARFQSWTGGRCGRHSTASWRCPGWPAGRKEEEQKRSEDIRWPET